MQVTSTAALPIAQSIRIASLRPKLSATKGKTRSRKWFPRTSYPEAERLHSPCSGKWGRCRAERQSKERASWYGRVFGPRAAGIWTAGTGLSQQDLDYRRCRTNRRRRSCLAAARKLGTTLLKKSRRMFLSTFPPRPPSRSAFIKEKLAAMASFSAPFTATVHLTFWNRLP